MCSRCVRVPRPVAASRWVWRSDNLPVMAGTAASRYSPGFSAASSLWLIIRQPSSLRNSRSLRAHSVTVGPTASCNCLAVTTCPTRGRRKSLSRAFAPTRFGILICNQTAFCRSNAYRRAGSPRLSRSWSSSRYPLHPAPPLLSNCRHRLPKRSPSIRLFFRSGPCACRRCDRWMRLAAIWRLNFYV